LAAVLSSPGGVQAFQAAFAALMKGTPAAMAARAPQPAVPVSHAALLPAAPSAQQQQDALAQLLLLQRQPTTSAQITAGQAELGHGNAQAPGL
jgi:hypothetical protein